MLTKLWFTGSGAVIGILGALCLLFPQTFIKLDKAMSMEVKKIDKLSMPFRLIVGLGLVWLGIFVATLPRFFQQ